jgi:hypothetical protein
VYVHTEKKKKKLLLLLLLRPMELYNTKKRDKGKGEEED